MPRASRRQRLGGAEVEERLQQRLGVIGEPQVDARLHALARRRRQRLVGEQDEARLQRVVALDDAGDRRALPAQRAVAGEDEIAVGGGRHPLGALGDLAGERLLRGGAQRLRLRTVGIRVGREAEAVEAADMLALRPARRRSA